MSEIIFSIIGTIGTLGGGFFALIKSGYIQIGKVNGNGPSKLAEIDEHLEILTTNHLSHIQEAINKNIEISGEILVLLKEVEKYGIKIRKE